MYHQSVLDYVWPIFRKRLLVTQVASLPSSRELCSELSIKPQD